MRHQWFSPIALLFRPEAAGSCNSKRHFAGPAVPPGSRQPQVSVKALVWMAFAVCIALAIGQLY